MPRRLAQQRMNLNDLELPFHSLSVPSVWEGHANVNALCTSSTLKSTSSASCAIFAVAEFLVKINNSMVMTCYQCVLETAFMIYSYPVSSKNRTTYCVSLDDGPGDVVSYAVHWL